jgi:hypothetical protein
LANPLADVRVRQRWKKILVQALGAVMNIRFPQGTIFSMVRWRVNEVLEHWPEPHNKQLAFLSGVCPEMVDFARVQGGRQIRTGGIY